MLNEKYECMSASLFPQILKRTFLGETANRSWGYCEQEIAHFKITPQKVTEPDSQPQSVRARGQDTGEPCQWIMLAQ